MVQNTEQCDHPCTTVRTVICQRSLSSKNERAVPTAQLLTGKAVGHSKLATRLISCGQDSRPQLFPENPRMYLEKYRITNSCQHEDTHTQNILVYTQYSEHTNKNNMHTYTHTPLHTWKSSFACCTFLQSWAYICTTWITHYTQMLLYFQYTIPSSIHDLMCTCIARLHHTTHMHMQNSSHSHNAHQGPSQHRVPGSISVSDFTLASPIVLLTNISPLRCLFFCPLLLGILIPSYSSGCNYSRIHAFLSFLPD